jgi:phospho-N-acetylmuramoyl-pentapeptide-transferase
MLFAEILFSTVPALIGSVIFALIFIPFLRAVKAGQPIKKIGPVWHAHKEGTPTMGGWIFIFGTAAGVAVYLLRQLFNSSAEMENITWKIPLALFAFSMVYGFIGFADDLKKITKRDNDGLSSKQKFFLQLAAALAFILLLRYLKFMTPNLYVPFIGATVALPMLAYEVFAAFVIVGAVNAVNITDGVDGMLTGVSLPIVACLFLIAWKWQMTEQMIFALTLGGALVGFLFFNFNPAKVFMGDTGSLFLGGAICALAFSLDVPLVLAPMCLIFIWEVISDLIQVSYFKYTKRKYGSGKRIFKMAPFHHHLEKSGWSEKKIFCVFTFISIICSVVAYCGVAARYTL